MYSKDKKKIQKGNYVKVIGLKFDILNGLDIILDFNRKNFEEAGELIDQHNDDNIIYIGIPCSYEIK